jgi:hypothetical protein
MAALRSSVLRIWSAAGFVFQVWLTRPQAIREKGAQGLASNCMSKQDEAINVVSPLAPRFSHGTN